MSIKLAKAYRRRPMKKAGIRPVMMLSTNRNVGGIISRDGLFVTGPGDSEKTTVLITL